LAVVMEGFEAATKNTTVRCFLAAGFCHRARKRGAERKLEMHPVQKESLSLLTV
jgi:cytidylate kinase